MTCVCMCVCRVRAAEGSALRALKEKLFSHRSELMSGFQQYDQNNTGALFSFINMYLPSLTCIVFICKHIFYSGSVSVSEWALVLESVLRLDVPWRTLRPHLVRLAPDGSVEYQSCFEDMGPGIPLPQVREVKGSSSFTQVLSLEAILRSTNFNFILF